MAIVAYSTSFDTDSAFTAFIYLQSTLAKLNPDQFEHSAL